MDIRLKRIYDPCTELRRWFGQPRARWEELRRRRLLGRRSMWDPAAWRVTEAGER
jgi:hypothetical protein